jgi:hypothetical protein
MTHVVPVSKTTSDIGSVAGAPSSLPGTPTGLARTAPGQQHEEASTSGRPALAEADARSSDASDAATPPQNVVLNSTARVGNPDPTWGLAHIKDYRERPLCRAYMTLV